MKPLEKELASLIIDKLMLTGITADTMKISASLVDEYGLDSIDFLELAMAIAHTYNVEFAEDDKENTTRFFSVETIANHIETVLEGRNSTVSEKEETTVSSPSKTSDFEQNVFNEIAMGLHEMFEFPIDSLKYETRLVEDLELDSLDALDLVVRLQDTLDVRIPDDDLMKLKTISDVVAVIMRLSKEVH